MTEKRLVNTRFIIFIMGMLSFFLLISVNQTQAWEACPPHVDVKSKNSNIPTSITFKVDPSVPFPIDIMWINQFGKMEQYHSLSPGNSLTQETYVGHVWAAYDGGNCEYFDATSTPLMANIVVDADQGVPLNDSHFTSEEKFFGTDIYGEVRGWRVVQGDVGCSAYKIGTGASPAFNTPPAGGWQIIYRSFNLSGDVKGVIDVDKASFPQTFYIDSGLAYGEFPINLRLAVKAGDLIKTQIGTAQYEHSLSGATAALLKVQECWQQMSGWTPASNKAGTFAFSGD